MGDKTKADMNRPTSTWRSSWRCSCWACWVELWSHSD